MGLSYEQHRLLRAFGGASEEIRKAALVMLEESASHRAKKAGAGSGAKLFPLKKTRD